MQYDKVLGPAIRNPKIDEIDRLRYYGYVPDLDNAQNNLRRQSLVNQGRKIKSLSEFNMTQSEFENRFGNNSEEYIPDSEYFPHCDLYSEKIKIYVSSRVNELKGYEKYADLFKMIYDAINYDAFHSVIELNSKNVSHKGYIQIYTADMLNKGIVSIPTEYSVSYKNLNYDEEMNDYRRRIKAYNDEDIIPFNMPSYTVTKNYKFTPEQYKYIINSFIRDIDKYQKYVTIKFGVGAWDYKRNGWKFDYNEPCEIHGSYYSDTLIRFYADGSIYGNSDLIRLLDSVPEDVLLYAFKLSTDRINASNITDLTPQDLCIDTYIDYSRKRVFNIPKY